MRLQPVNLLPHREWARHAHRNRFVFEALAALVMVLLLAMLAWLTLASQRDTLRAGVEMHRQRLGEVQKLVMQRQKVQQALKDLQEQRSGAERLWQQQLEVLALWQQVAKALPTGVYLTQFTVNANSRSLQAMGATEADALTLQRGLMDAPKGWQPFELVEVRAQAPLSESSEPRKQFLLHASPIRELGAAK